MHTGIRCVLHSYYLPAVALLAFCVARAATGWAFAEGYSSSSEDGFAAISYRAFTIYTGPEACNSAAKVNRLSVRLEDDDVRVGTRVYRMNTADPPTPDMKQLIVAAYDDKDVFQPSVPITVTVSGDSKVVQSRGDWNYFEILGPGEIEVQVYANCARSSPVSETLRLSVAQ